MWSSPVMADNRPTQTVRQCAARHGVTERTVWQWIEKGAVKVTRRVTPGGAVRVEIEEPDSSKPRHETA